MKKYFSHFLLVAILCCAFSACQKTWDEPEFAIPRYTGPVANKTLQDIVNMVSNLNGGVDSICHATDTFIVKATVVSSDEGGNFYKTMVVQDETAALQIQINRSGLFTDYPVGQTIYIKCNGLVVGDYHGVCQIGWIYNGAVGRIDANFLDQYLFKDGLPQPISPIDITTSAGLQNGNISKLVRIKNCTFAQEDVGKPWSSDEITGERTITSINGSATTETFIVRTSNYAKFRKHLVPNGAGDIVGILSKYNNTYQLMLRDATDVGTFGNTADILNLTIQNDWICQPNAGGWQIRNQQGLHAGSSTECTDWLISPEIPNASVNGSELYITTQMFSYINYDFENDYTVCYTTNYTGDPTTTQWTRLSFMNYPAEGEEMEVRLTGLQNINGNIRLGFCYQAHADCATQWIVKQIRFNKFTPAN